MKSAIFWLGLIICFLLFQPVFAQASDNFQQGKILFKAGKYKPAYKFLGEAYKENPNNLDISFYQGLTAFALGDYETAIMDYERILIMEPEAPRIKLELARTYLKIGSPEIARQYFQEVMATNPPKRVKQNIQTILASIDKSEQHHFLNGIAEVGLFFDDNVGVFPNDSIITVHNIPFELIGDQKSDTGLQFSGSIHHFYRFGHSPYSFKTSLTTFNNFYNKQKDNQLNYYEFSTGLIHHNNKNGFELLGKIAQIDIDSQQYLNLLGFNSKFDHKISNHFSFNVSLNFQDKNYKLDDKKDATTWTININPIYTFDTSRLSFIVEWTHEDADDPIYSYQRWATALRYDQNLPFDIVAYASVLFQTTDYKDEMPFFAVARNDNSTRVEAGFIKTLWRSRNHRQSLSAKLSYNYTQSESNIALYEYDKSIIMSALTVTF